MDHSNPRDADMAGQNRSSNQRQQMLGLILAVLVVAYGAYAFMGWNNAWNEKKTTDDYSAFVAATARADAIADPLQRCLGYPDLPGSHWDAETTRAYCELRNHRTTQLSDIEALLKQGKADEVDRVFKGYLDVQRRDPRQPGLLDTAFTNAGFGDANDNTRRIIDMWKQQSPNSAFALAASGVQYVDAAQQARGTGFSNDLYDQQVNGMNQQLSLAYQDLGRAVSLDPTITAVYPSMIHGGGMQDDDAYMYKSAELGLKADPSNFGIRLQIMNHAQPKWGSNFGGVEAQSAEDLSLVAKNPLLRMVAQNPAVYRATCDCNYSQAQTNQLVVQAADKNLISGKMVDLAAEVYDANRHLAVELYGEVLRFDPTNVDALRWRSQEMIALGDKQGAIAAFAAVSQRFPDNNAMTTQLGNIYAQVADVKRAETTLLAVLQRDPDNYDALGTLGDLYNHAGHQPQKAEALADILISKYPDKPNGYILRSCNQMDHNLPGVYDTIHHFIDRFGDDPQWQTQTAEMRAYLIKHPEKVAT
jgi:tetratricopeptide (TPR) repeat protein